jgi:hypothetical protein
MDDILKGGRGRAARFRKPFVNAIFCKTYLAPNMVNFLQNYDTEYPVIYAVSIVDSVS